MSNLISQGSYGCAFFPAYECNGEINNNIDVISKLVVNDDDASNEIYIGSLIIDINNYNLYFLPVIGDCSINIAQFDKKKLDECKIVSKRNDEKEYSLLTISYLKNIGFEGLFTNNAQNEREKLYNFIDTYRYLINSISHLLSINIVHYDLHHNNILLGTLNKIPIIIDFGLSIPINTLDITSRDSLKRYFYLYAPDDEVWPLEVHILCYYLNNAEPFEIITKDTIIGITNEVIDSNKILKIFSPKFVNEYKRSCISFFEQFFDKSIDEYINVFFELEFYKTIDCYSLSILYLDFFNDIFKNNIVSNNITKKIIKLLLTNISPDPNRRYPIDVTKQKCRELFY